MKIKRNHPMQRYALNGEIDKIENGIKNGFNINKIINKNRGHTLFAYVVKGGHLELCKRLLELGADINAGQKDSYESNLITVYVSIPENIRNPQILQCILENGYHKIEDIHIQKQIIIFMNRKDIEDTNSNGYKEVELLIKYIEDINFRDEYGCTILHRLLTTVSSSEVLMLLLELFIDNGADVLAETTLGNRPSYVASSEYYYGFFHNQKIYEYLIQKEQEKLEFLQGFKRAHIEADEVFEEIC